MGIACFTSTSIAQQQLCRIAIAICRHGQHCTLLHNNSFLLATTYDTQACVNPLTQKLAYIIRWIDNDSWFEISEAWQETTTNSAELNAH